MAKELTKAQMQELYKRAVDGYANKVKLEKPFKKTLDSFYDKVNSDFKSYYAKYGHVQNMQDYQKELESILNEQHIKAGNAFSSNLRNVYGKSPNDKSIQIKIDANVKGSAAQRAHLSSHKMIGTMSDYADKAVKNASVSLALSEEEITNASIARISSELLANSFVRSSVTATITETAAGAENGKDIESQTLNDYDAELDGLDGKSITEMQQQKVWIAILDAHTRDAHVEADGQTVNIDEPFEVDGEQLMEPCDDSMGASAENICNCRCSCEIILL